MIECKKYYSFKVNTHYIPSLFQWYLAYQGALK